MKLLQGQRLRQFVEKHIAFFEPENIGQTELDIRFGNIYWEEVEPLNLINNRKVHIVSPLTWQTIYKQLPADHGAFIEPGRFILAEALETFALPKQVQGMLTLRSWAAKSGLEQSSSLILKAGWQGSLILELSNSLRRHALLIPPRAVIGQIQFFDISEDRDDLR